RIPALWTAGSIMTREAVRHWLHFFEQVVLMYGSSEIGICAGLRLTEITDGAEIAYTLMPGVKAEILGEDGEVLPRGIPGILRLQTPAMSGSYVSEPKADAEVFRDGWFHPGDIGMLTEDGRLKILGRQKDQINLGGAKFNAVDIDMAAKTVPGIRDAMCFTMPSATGLQEFALCAVTDIDNDPLAFAAAIRAACRTHVQRGIEPSAIYFVDELPRTET